MLNKIYKSLVLCKLSNHFTMAGPNTCAENWTISGLKPTDPLPQFGWSCIYHNSKSKILKLQGRNK